MVTEMASSKLLQIKVKNVTKFEPVKETLSDADGLLRGACVGSPYRGAWAGWAQVLMMRALWSLV